MWANAYICWIGIDALNDIDKSSKCNSLIQIISIFAAWANLQHFYTIKFRTIRTIIRFLLTIIRFLGPTTVTMMVMLTCFGIVTAGHYFNDPQFS